MIQRIYLDMDGVIADFTSAILARFGIYDYHPRKWDFYEDLGIKKRQFFAACASHEFWVNIPETPWAMRLYNALSRYAPVTIATHPTHSPESLSGKVEWLQERFGNEFGDYMLCGGGSKHLLAAPSALLIDDNEEYCEAFQDRGGAAILFPATYNSNRGHVGSELAFVMSEVESICRAMQEVLV